MSADRRSSASDSPADGSTARVQSLGAFAGLYLSRIDRAFRLLFALFLVGVAAYGVREFQAVHSLWLVPLALVLLAFDPPRERRRHR